MLLLILSIIALFCGFPFNLIGGYFILTFILLLAFKNPVKRI